MHTVVWCSQEVRMSRSDVLSLYRRVLRIARSWTALSALPHDTDTERKDIAQEARTLFRQNQQVCGRAAVCRLISVLFSHVFSVTDNRPRINQEMHWRVWSSDRDRCASYIKYLLQSNSNRYQITGEQLKMIVLCLSCQDCIIGTPILDQ